MTWRIAALVVVLAPGVVSAQDAGTSWPGLDLKTADLSTVYVLDDTGVETSGRFLRLDPDSIVLLVGGVEQRFEAPRVRRIEKRGDSLRSGAIVGAIVGLAMALSVGRMADCPGSNPGGPCPGFRAAGILMFTGIGAGVDALVAGRTTLYEAPRAASGSSWALRGSRFGINLSVRW